MRLHPTIALLLIVLLAPLRGLGAQVRYSIRPIATDSLTHLRITVSTSGESDGTTRFALPEDRFGVAEMRRWIRDVTPGRETELTERDPGVYEATHAPDAPIEVSYTVGYDPTNAGFKPFGPSVDTDHFHFFGSQWMARVGESKGEHDIVRDIEVVLERAGRDGSWVSSFGLGEGPHQVRASDYDLDYSVIAGGDYRTETIDCRGRPIVVGIHGEFGVRDEEIFDVAGRIACGQREVFADFDRPFFSIVITERDDLEAGAPLLNGFTAFLEASTSRDELMGLLAHEMIHTWLPRSARLVEAEVPDAAESRTRWFHEGFTEYLSRLTLVEQGLMSRSRMIERTNDDLVRLAYQPYATLTLDELETAGREGRYTGIHHRLHYVRGALLALNWDARILRASGGRRSIVDPIRLVLETARGGDGTIEMAELTRIFERFGVDAERDVARYLEGGLPLRPEPDAFGPAYELRTREIPAFDPGFDVLRWLLDGEVTGVTPDGPAARAGLRDGMKIARSGNAAPWFGRWDPSEPSIFLIEMDPEDAAGEDGRRFEVPAAGAPIEIARYERRDEAPTSRCSPNAPALGDALERIDDMLDARRGAAAIPGLAAGVVCGDSLVFAAGHGIMAVDDSTPVNPRTPFRIASVTKVFTATAAVMQEEAGALALDDPVKAHLDWFEIIRPPETGDAPITIRQLLTHTSGLPRDSRLTDFSRGFQPGRAEAVGALPDQRLRSPPGESNAYSNLGYGVLGEVVAETSGLTYAEFLERRIFEPLDMGRTLVHPSPEDHTAWGHGPLRSDGSRTRAGFWDLGFATPAGGMASSVVDLARFVRLQLAPYLDAEPALLSADAIRDMHRVQFVMDPSRGGSGLGWAVETSNGQHLVYHGGELPDQTSFLLIDLKAHIGVIVLTNAEDVDAGGLAQDVLWRVRRAVVDPGAPVPHPAIPPAPSNP